MFFGSGCASGSTISTSSASLREWCSQSRLRRADAVLGRDRTAVAAHHQIHRVLDAHLAVVVARHLFTTHAGCRRRRSPKEEQRRWRRPVAVELAADALICAVADLRDRHWTSKLSVGAWSHQHFGDAIADRQKASASATDCATAPSRIQPASMACSSIASKRPASVSGWPGACRSARTPDSGCRAVRSCRRRRR